jgi:hypothetical protein
MTCTGATLLLVFALLGCYAALVGSSLMTLWKTLSAPFSRRQVHRGVSLKSRKFSLFELPQFVIIVVIVTTCITLLFVFKQSSVLGVQKEL